MKIFEVTNSGQPPKPKPRRPVWPSFDKKPEDFGVKHHGMEPPKWHRDQSGTIVYDDPEYAAHFRATTDAHYAQPNYKAYQDALNKHHAEQRKQIADLHKSRGSFDYTTTIRNPKFDPNATGDDVAMGTDDDDTDWEDYEEPEEIDVGIDYDIDPGEPATRDNPGHSASVDFTRVVDLDTGEDITNSIDFDTDEWNQIEIDIVEQEGEPDDYYDESVHLEDIKKLSGLK
jgi:hypothetical protein